MMIVSQIAFLITSCRGQFSGKHDVLSEVVWNYHISDWLINFEGGFVRRGLIGEMLYLIYKFTHVNIPVLITVFSFCLLLLFSFLFVRKWLQYRLSVILLPSFVLLGGIGGGNSFMWFRRDVLIYLLVWAAFVCYSKLLKNKKKYEILFQIVAIITILSHEASFFYMLPIVACHYFFLNLKNHRRKESLMKVIILSFPTICTFIICSIFKGNEEVANAIWNSWNPMFVQLCIGDVPMGLGPNALTWNTITTFKYHAMLNFIKSDSGIPGFLLWPFVYLAILYLLVNINRIVLCSVDGKKPFSVIKYMHVLLIVCFFMLPMFTVLSCDNKRLMLYCTITSFLFYFSVPSNMLGVFYHKQLSNCIKRISSFMTQGVLQNKWIFILVLLFAGMPSVYFSFESIFKSSMVGLSFNLINKALLILGL